MCSVNVLSAQLQGRTDGWCYNLAVLVGRVSGIMGLIDLLAYTTLTMWPWPVPGVAALTILSRPMLNIINSF